MPGKQNTSTSVGLAPDSGPVRSFIKERQKDGIQRAKASGRYAGGKRRIDRYVVRELLAQGQSVAAAARTLGCSRMQIYRIIGDAPPAA